MALVLVSGAVWNITCTICQTGSVPGDTGARRGPRRAENRPTNPEPDFFPKVCPTKSFGSRPKRVETIPVQTQLFLRSKYNLKIDYPRIPARTGPKPRCSNENCGPGPPAGPSGGRGAKEQPLKGPLNTTGKTSMGQDLRFRGLRYGPILAVKLMWTDQNPVPNCPGLRPGQCGTGFWFVQASFPVEFGPNRSPTVASIVPRKSRRQATAWSGLCFKPGRSSTISSGSLRGCQLA